MFPPFIASRPTPQTPNRVSAREAVRNLIGGRRIKHATQQSPSEAGRSCPISRHDRYKALGRKPYDVVLVDVRLGDADGFDLLAHVHQQYPHSSVILITGYGSVESAVEAIRAGAFDFLTKPLIDDELEMAIESGKVPAVSVR